MLFFPAQRWSATTSQLATRWLKCSREFREVQCRIVTHSVPDAEILHQHVKQLSKSLRRSGSRPHPCRAPLCDLTVDGCVDVASLALQKHGEAGEGRADLLHEASRAFFSHRWTILACFQVSLLSMGLTLAVLITVIIRAATLGPQMCEGTVLDSNAYV